MKKPTPPKGQNGNGAPEASQEPVIITEHQNYVKTREYYCPFCGNAFQTMDTVFIFPNADSRKVLCYNCVENLEQIPNRIAEHVSFLVCAIEDLQDYAYREFRIERLKKD